VAPLGKLWETIRMSSHLTRHRMLILSGTIGVLILALWWFAPQKNTSCNVAYLTLHGDLVTYIPDSESASSSNAFDQTASNEVTQAIRDTSADESMKAIILEIDSPGGSPVAGEEIQSALKRSVKPTVALIREQGDSAAYMAATGANAIFASAFSDVGDIGITQSYVDNAKQDEASGLTFNQLSIGKYKDMFNTDKLMTSDERALAMKELQIGYDRFVQIVSDNRDMSVAAVTKLADGSSLMGQEAKDAGLIDDIGNIDNVRTYLSQKLHTNAVICGIDD
jgi:protease-4